MIMNRLLTVAKWIAWSTFFIIVLIELAVRFRWYLSPVYEYLLGPTILNG